MKRKQQLQLNYQISREKRLVYQLEYYQKNRERLIQYQMQRYNEIKPKDGERSLRCKGLCTEMDIQNRRGNMVSTHLKQGYKICRNCNVMIKEPTFRCPCCKLILSTRLTRRR